MLKIFENDVVVNIELKSNDIALDKIEYQLRKNRYYLSHLKKKIYNFTYVDSDGNETDIVGESGLVSLFIGQYPTSVRGGFRNENTHKRVRFQISNIR